MDPATKLKNGEPIAGSCGPELRKVITLEA